MSFSAQLYRILIASPGDVVEERDAVVKAIQEWNNLNAAQRGVAILPVRWETHSTPEMGDRPQGIINRRFADDCDAVIGIFWTRFGSPTGVSASGTLEEIDRAIESGRPVMLYFSEAPQRPDNIDLAQLDSLRKFRSGIRNQGLIQTYSSAAEFKELLPRHLESQIRTLLAAENTEDGGEENKSPSADIRIVFDTSAMGLKALSDDATECEMIVEYYSVSESEKIPDFTVGQKAQKNSFLSSLREANTNYYRESAAYLRDRAFRRLSFVVENVGSIGARDVHFEIDVKSETPITLASSNTLTLDEPEKIKNFATVAKNTRLPKTARSWTTREDIGAAQPKRIIHRSLKTFVAAWENSTIKIKVKIYADILPEPLERELTLHCKVSQTELNVAALIERLTHDGAIEKDGSNGSPSEDHT